jgi:DNA-binding protein WhiA
MSLTERLRDELAGVTPRRSCDRLAEVSALFHTAGTLQLHGGGKGTVVLDLGESVVARRAFALLRSFELAAEIRTYRRRAFDRATRYQLHLDVAGRALQVLEEAGVLTPALAPVEQPPRRIVARRCCRRSYLRSALLAAGSLSGPASPHLEIRCSSREAAEFVVAVAEEEEVPLGVVDRDRHAAAYAKGATSIAGLLLAVGAQELVLVLEERAVVAATRSQANRLANADHANLVRTSRAAQRQLSAVRRLERRGDLDGLAPELRELAELRLEHPSLSMRELATRCRPAVSKATAYRRLCKLVELGRSA